MAYKIDVLHPAYKKRTEQWQRLRDCLEGGDAVKSKTTTYLPKLSGDKNGELYANYLKRAQFLAVCSRTLEGLVGFVTRKTPRLEMREKDKELLADVGPAGESLDDLSRCLLHELLSVSRVGLFVDAPRSVDGVEAVKPFLALYDTEDITDWAYAVVEGRRELVDVVLREMEETKDHKGEYVRRTTYRRLRLVPRSELAVAAAQVGSDQAVAVVQEGSVGDLVYFQEVWRKTINDKGQESAEYILQEVYVPRQAGGRTLDRIPFFPATPFGLDIHPPVPAMLPLADVNLHHYMGSADLEWGRHWTAIPQPWAAGFKHDNGELTIGSAFAWISDDPQANAGYLEFTGAGLGSLVTGQEDKMKQMAMLGARMLEAPAGGGVEAAATVRLRQAGEQSVVALAAKNASMAMTRALRAFLGWLSLAKQDSVEVSYTMSVVAADVNPQLLATMVQMVLQNLMSWESLFAFLERFELLPDGTKKEEELARILAGGPGALLGFTPSTAPGAPSTTQEDDESEEDDEEEEAA
jgi:hypothetical protein